ncbi:MULTISPECIES: hypothetical protein [unclassified Arthrobacter]|uniref:hypothetical protein n=1 Tax=unclassified Pseudarthrobacter TaxID=2647000 RepID=UPI003396E982
MFLILHQYDEAKGIGTKRIVNINDIDEVRFPSGEGKEMPEVWIYWTNGAAKSTFALAQFVGEGKFHRKATEQEFIDAVAKAAAHPGVHLFPGSD